MQKEFVTDKYSLIENIPLFSKLSFFQKKLIVSKCQVVEFKKGDIIYEEGDEPDYFCCMVNGRVEIFHPAGTAGKAGEHRIEVIRKGDYFGLISALTGKPHTVSARALNDSIVVRIENRNFEHILRKMPKLAVVLSRALSRRLGRKPFKEIFESKVIAVYGVNGSVNTAAYVKQLAKALKDESGKKVMVVSPDLIAHVKEVSPRLSDLTGEYHYILADAVSGENEVGIEILKQSDICHILSPSDKESLCATSRLLKRLEGPFEKNTGQSIQVILKEDRYFSDTAYGDKVRILSREVFATLPGGRPGYRKTVRRIAREISGVRIGLVLGSGAAVGLAHVGVLKVLEKEKIPVDIIAGCSIGAMIAALWAVGYTAAEIEKMMCAFNSRLRTVFLIDPILPIRGLIKGRAVRKVLDEYLKGKTFFDTGLPLKIVACDIRSRKEYIIDKGSLADAVMASMAIPGVFEPVEYDGTQLVDGGIIDPVPVDVLSREGIKKIIAVNVLPSPEEMVFPLKKKLNIYNIIVHSFQTAEYEIAKNSCRQADVYLHPVPEAADWHEFHKAALFVKGGQEEALRVLHEIKRL